MVGNAPQYNTPSGSRRTTGVSHYYIIQRQVSSDELQLYLPTNQFLGTMALFQLLLLAIKVQAATAILSAACSPGPAFPPIDLVLNKYQARQVGHKLDEAIKNVLSKPDGWKTNTTSFAVQVTTGQNTIWDSYYTAPILGEYKDSEPKDVSGDTAFRIASISKSFTVYAVLLENKINLEDSITKYIPELLARDSEEGYNEETEVQWNQITIRSLASQLSGIAREGK